MTLLNMRNFSKVLVANRGEIAIRVFRACTELNIETAAIYSEEDSTSLHRFKADEAYLVGEGKKPIDAYLDIEGIISIAKHCGADAIHPGYGFLAENADFARRCEEAGLAFIGPRVEHLEMFGDKMAAKHRAVEAGLPVVPGTTQPVTNAEDVIAFGDTHGYPIIAKAAAGGGGRGMRIIRSRADAAEAFERAQSEAKASFGRADVYLEKYVEKPKHIEVQILADQTGEVMHLFERDCSIQRRYQKVVETAPSLSLDSNLRRKICAAAVQLCQHVRYLNAGTVEFLVAQTGDFYFIEVNPRIQVEHTVTELITGIDLVHSQIRVAEGYLLHDPEVGLPQQDQLDWRGYAIQCRITTEDPANNFMPETGRILAYRTSGGLGIRLDGGNGYQGSTISPHYDSLLVKVSTWALNHEQAARKMRRCLREMRIRGVKTNIPFLMNVIQHPTFMQGTYDTSFIDTTPELFEFTVGQDRGTKLLRFIANQLVNKHPEKKRITKKPNFAAAPVPQLPPAAEIVGTRDRLLKLGPDDFSRWIKQQDRLLVTDTTFRDAHQSLYATRFRTYDMLKIAEATNQLAHDVFSVEMWGGATFDVSMRFLKEDPWDRLRRLRSRMPNVLLQMLLRGSNAVGYTSYPDNAIQAFVHEAAAQGIDVFRVFDSLNWIEGMRPAMNYVLETGKILEACVCYTGDIHNPQRQKYDLQYYVSMAKELEKAGAHIIAIKDMAGLLKPYAAYDLVSALKDAVDLPIHLHSHDGSGSGLAMYLKAAEAGVDIVDTAISSVSGMTAQPSLNGLVAALTGHARDTELSLENLDALADYWETVTDYYRDFFCGLKSTSTKVYQHEMPGGQYSNLQQQARAIGLGHRFEEVTQMYQKVNVMFGDIIKVTPSSKVVGDMALFMVQNNLTGQDIHARDNLDFPNSVVEFMQGYLGQPYQGFPEQLQKAILKGRQAITERPGSLLEPIDLDDVKQGLEAKFNRTMAKTDVLSSVMYPQVYAEFEGHRSLYSDVSVFDTPTFFYGLRLGEEVKVEIEKGKTLIIKLLYVGELQPDRTRTVSFELNGQFRQASVIDESADVDAAAKPKADPNNPNQIGTPMPGTVLKLLVSEGDEVVKGEHLMVTEAMKMETTIQAPKTGVVQTIHVQERDTILPGDLLITLTD